jgi:hypothetical protein
MPSLEELGILAEQADELQPRESSAICDDLIAAPDDERNHLGDERALALEPH